MSAQYRPCGVRLPVPAAWETAIAGFISERRAIGRPATSLRSYAYSLEHFARRAEGGPWDQTRATLIEYFSNQDWKPETRRQRLNTLRAFYGWGVVTGQIDTNPATEIPSVKATAPRPRPAPNDVYLLALATAPPRERLMLRLSLELGMRRAEVARCAREDLTRESANEWTLTIYGKGGKVRVLPTPAGLAYEIRQRPPGFLFPGDCDGHLSPEYVGKRIAALMPGGYTMHTLRHAYATRLYGMSHDLLLVQEALGHSSPETTRRYVATDNRDRLRGFMEEMAGGLSRPAA